MASCRLLPVLLIAVLLLPGCAFRRISRAKNITYTSQVSGRKLPTQSLNVFVPHYRSGDSLRDVLLFIHGGNWTSGKKSLYSWLGSRLARKGIVAVVIDYPKSPDANYQDMASDVAAALQWTRAHIAQYGGNPDRVFVSGHSAGGHLAALAGTDSSTGPLIRGLVLIDAAGLDMYGYLSDGGISEHPAYPVVFSRDPQTWKAATPLYHLHKGVPPMLILRGGRTYPSIITSNEKFVAALRALGNSPVYIVQPRRKHIPMITQFFNTGNPRYRDIRRFMKDTR